MLTRRRILLAVSVLLMAAVAWSAWLVVQTARDLRAAQASVEQLRASITADDAPSRMQAISDLNAAAASAEENTGGLWWSAMTHVPFVGDDAAGVRALSASLDLIARDGIRPVDQVVRDLDTLVVNGRVDVDLITRLQPTLSDASSAFGAAAALVEEQDSSDFAGALRTRYDDFAEQVSTLRDDLGSAETATQVLPGMLGQDGPRRYLMVFENNAEIRATGGLPGSWAVINADNGQLTMDQQGSAADFDVYDPPLGDLTDEEVALFGPEMGRFFQDPNFTPDFPRAAEVFDSFWSAQFPEQPIDGVVSIDVVALSYLMRSIGPVQVGDVSLSADNVVQELLSDIYADLEPAAQDETFRAVARTVFDAVTTGGADPLSFVGDVGDAVGEGRFRVASFDAEEQRELSGTRIAGELSSDDGGTPHVDIALNDATASKMSYYLRYSSRVTSQSCDDDQQQLDVNIALSQTIPFDQAKQLPPYVTGGVGFNSVEPGTQLVRVHVFAPYEGTISDIKIDGKLVTMPEVVNIEGRPAVTLAVLIDSTDDVLVTLRMESGSGQTAGGSLTETPGVVPGSNQSNFASAC